MGRRGSRVRSQEAIASWLGPKPVDKGWIGCVCGVGRGGAGSSGE